jgi:hypothetical protein
MALLKCSATNIRKRKLSGDQLNSMDNECQTTCAKRRGVGSSGSYTENNSYSTKLEVLVLNGEWTATQTVPSITGETCSLTLPNLGDFNEFSIPCSESTGSEISMEDNDDGTIKHCSEGVERSDFLESTPITTHSDGEYKHINNAENNCDNNLSWLINFKVGSLFNAAEVQSDHIVEGRVEDTTCSGMY